MTTLKQFCKSLEKDGCTVREILELLSDEYALEQGNFKDQAEIEKCCDFYKKRIELKDEK